MKLNNARLIEMISFDPEMTDEERKIMRDYGYEKIQKDEKMLVNYGFLCMISEMAHEIDNGKDNNLNVVDKAKKSDKIVSEVKDVVIKRKRGRPAKVK